MLCLQDYVVFQNPLLLHLDNDSFPYVYSREQGVDYFSFKGFDEGGLTCKKKVLLWHMQSNFNFYASKYVLRQKLLGFLPLGRVCLDLKEQSLSDRLNKRAHCIFKHINRLDVYKYYFQKADFSGLFRHWWKKGVFTVSQPKKSVVSQWKEGAFYHSSGDIAKRDDIQISLKYLKDKKARILETGCGFGEITRFLIDNGYENIEGIEINPQTVGFLNASLPHLKVLQGDLLKLPYEKESFDVVLSYGAIEHYLEGPKVPLKGLYDILKPGGIGVVSIQSFNPIRRLKYFLSFLNIIRFLDMRKNNVVRKWFHKKPYPEWVVKRAGKKNSYYIYPQYGAFCEYRLTRKQFEALCKDVGFEILESIPTDHIAGIYQEFGWPLVTLNKDDDFDVKTPGYVVNKVLSKIPFFQNHSHVCVVQKKKYG
jgi:SAM-dependent methyltransferase